MLGYQGCELSDNTGAVLTYGGDQNLIVHCDIPVGAFYFA
jgi:hypothetical protein